MTANKLIIFGLLGMCQLIFAQQDSIVALKEVTVSDTQLRNFSRTQAVAVLNDSVIARNAASLTALLNYNSTLYFKENGLGMVSSPSFRGTTAQQTAVIWNGININSQLNGQTDFNTIPSGGFDNITIRGGGGSALYGSSAIGGSIHLNNDLDFRNKFENELRLSYGSYNTFGGDYKLETSNQKMSTQLGISRHSSDNDYAYRDGRNNHNENGQYYNTAMHVAFGYQLNRKNFLKLYSQVFEGERHFSGTLAAKSKSKYQDLNTRNLVEWDAFLGQWTSKVKVAFLSERYKYFENAKTALFESSRAETMLAKYDLGYAFNSKISANVILDYTQTKGTGQQIGENVRDIGSVALLFKHQLASRFGYELSMRKELTDDYKSPFLFAAGTYFQPFKNYSLLLNFSRNFRIPTFNDLYWQGLGNPDLKPESSHQAEFGQQIKLKDFFVSVTAYYIDITDMIQWAPSASYGVWMPNNVAHVRSYGAELLLEWRKKIGISLLNFRADYGYTVSEDQASKEQLIYVPEHKANANLAYAYKKWSADYQFLFNGWVFTPSQKYNVVEEYWVSNAGIDYDFGKKNTIKTGFRVLNLWDEKYQSVLQRPMPGRNYAMSLTLKF